LLTLIHRKSLLVLTCIAITAGCVGFERQSKPAAVPEIDFKGNLVLFARNIHFFNRISIGKVNVTNGVAQVLAMETMSAMPIEDKVAMSLVVVSRSGITAIQTGDDIFPVNKKL